MSIQIAGITATTSPPSIQIAGISAGAPTPPVPGKYLYIDSTWTLVDGETITRYLYVGGEWVAVTTT